MEKNIIVKETKITWSGSMENYTLLNWCVENAIRDFFEGEGLDEGNVEKCVERVLCEMDLVHETMDILLAEVLNDVKK